jgi:hypothetical protein
MDDELGSVLEAAYDGGGASSRKVEAYIDKLLARIPRWIPMTERLPDDGLEVLVTADGWMRIAYRTITDGWRIVGHGKLDTARQPTHWMPLPWGLPRP